MKFSSKMDEKMTCDILVDPLSPVSFGDTVSTPVERHVLFEWPLNTYFLNDPLVIMSHKGRNRVNLPC